MSTVPALAVVRKHLAVICPHIPTDAMTPEASMRDLGASSLDIVEVVSCSMRELRVRIPRTELQGLRNLGDLAGLLDQAAAPGV